MGHSLTSIPFFTDDIAIRPHTATDGDLIGHRVTIARFAKGRPVALRKRDDNGEYVVACAGGDFMEGPEA